MQPGSEWYAGALLVACGSSVVLMQCWQLSTPLLCCSGVWTKDMKIRTNLAQPQITKILKTLEGRNLIKSVKSVNNPSRKLYMLFELEPSREITGGAW
jgi:DNA-binding MarR family transcriptional regulator